MLQNSVEGWEKSHTESICSFAVWSLENNSFFYLLFGFPTANVEVLSREQPLLPNVNHCVLAFVTFRLPGALSRG